MTDRRALFGGIGLAIGGLPLILFYGAAPIGYAGLGVSVLGLVVAYEARKY